MLISFIDLFFLFFFSLATLFVMRKFAKRIGLVDKPNARKLHNGAVPLVGGISICISLLYFLLNNQGILPNSFLYAACISILTVIGALDDKFDVSYKVRFAIQAFLSVLMIVVGGIELRTVGDIIGSGQIVTLGWFGCAITVVAVIAAINAFNMVDGIDGLLGFLSIVTFCGLAVLLVQDGQNNIAYLCIVMVTIISPYILLNLGVFGKKRKIFMGDAGSMLIGFTVIWFLLQSSQNGSAPPLRPVTALWLIAVPLMDMAAIMMRRIQKGYSPFKPDREHLHHIFQRLGFNSMQTLVVITMISSVFAVVGVFSEVLDVPEYIMFYLFLVCFMFYCLFLGYISKKTNRLVK